MITFHDMLQSKLKKKSNKQTNKKKIRKKKQKKSKCDREVKEIQQALKILRADRQNDIRNALKEAMQPMDVNTNKEKINYIFIKIRRKNLYKFSQQLTVKLLQIESDNHLSAQQKEVLY